MAHGSRPTTYHRILRSIVTLRTYLPRERLRGVQSKIATSYPSGTLWPHGEWSLGWAKNRADGGEWHEDVYTGLGVDDVGMAARAADGPQALNLSDAPNSHKRPRRGLKGITGYGQQMVKAAGHLLQEKYPHHRKTLGTITLPPMSREARAQVAEAWPDLVRELLQWLTRRLLRLGLPTTVVSVSEIQPKRLAESGEAVLHLHLLWLNVPARAGHWSVCPNDLRSWFSGLLERHIPSYGGGHVNVNVKPVEGVVAAYLAKYMSKGKQMIAEALEDWGGDICPRTWWNMTKPARDMVKAATFKGREPGAILEAVLEHAFATDVDAHYAYLRHIEMEFDGVRYTVGWRGRLCESIRDDIRGMLESSDIARLEGLA